MATVTIGTPYFKALLRRAEFHTSGHEFDTTPSLSSNVTISMAEHEYLLQGVREYNLLKSALFRGGLTTETLDTLLSGEGGVTHEEHTPPTAYSTSTWEERFVKSQSMSDTMQVPRHFEASADHDKTAVGDSLRPRLQPHSNTRVYSFGQPDTATDIPSMEDDFQPSSNPPVQTHEQRTILITNLSERTTHKDLVSIIRGGRLLDIYLRNDRSATISFVEGAQEFLVHAKRNDIYLHTKRLEFRWNDRQFHVPPHVANKIANGASRNLVVRCAAGKFTDGQIRDHLDHIHNLVVVDINFKNGDAYVSTNSIHNALFARTCMMSRTVYKGLRIDWYADECAAPLPRRPNFRAQTSDQSLPMKRVPFANRYNLLDTGSDPDSDSDADSFLSSGVRLDRSSWAARVTN